MKLRPKISGPAVLMVLYVLMLPKPAYAYIDPNATNLLTQMLTPLLVVVVTGVTFLRKQAGSAIGRLAGWVRRKK
jgi:hypothetical protein